MNRYSSIETKRKREIVLLRGRGCAYRKCSFCDYHLDSCADDAANFLLNKSVLDRVTGRFSELEVINSGSVFELDGNTLDYIKTVCRAKNIKTLHFEAHYMYRELIPRLRRDFSEFDLKLKLGLETFDGSLREGFLHKGISEENAEDIALGFDEANFLFGITGQTERSMRDDILLGLAHFERICINVFCENSTSVKPDRGVIEVFMREIYPEYKDDPRVDILLENTDFGVGD